MQLARDSRALVQPRLAGHVEFVLQLPDTELVGRPQQRQKNGRAKGAKPVGLPPGGRDENGQRHPFFIPYAIAVRSLHAKNIFTGIQIGVSSQALLAAHLVPARVKALELISITVLLGIRVAQRREFKGEDIVPVGESQGIHVWDGFLEYRLSADGHGFVEDFEASDHYRRHVGIVP